MFKNKKLFLFFSFVLIATFLFIVKNALATGTDILGVEAVDSEIILDSTDPRLIIVRVVNIFLGLLGVIAVSLIIFGGFMWMTSEGNEERVAKAKRVLKNAVIGLIIVLAAWGIVTFIFRSLFPGGQPGVSVPTDKSSFFQSGLGAIGNCSLESVYPDPGQKAVPRNTMIMATFKEDVASSSINDSNVVICEESNFNVFNRTCDNSIGFDFSTNDNKIFVFYPQSLLGNENGFSNYVVYFTNDILKIDESASIFSNCSNNYFLWDFEVSNLLDLTPPKVESVFPQPDNLKDQISISSTLSFASASISVISVPSIFQPAGVTSVTINNNATSTDKVQIGANYNGDYTNFQVIVEVGNKAQLRSGNISLGVFDIINNQVNFTNYFTLNSDSGLTAGSEWSIVVTKRSLADAITVGNYVYTFISGSTNGYNIKSSLDPIEQAQQIVLALSTHPNVNVSSSGSLVSLTAKVGGSSGNGIVLSSSNSSKISTTAFAGGSDQSENFIISDKKDKPMNSVIQINFNEVVNPLTVSGNSNEVFEYIRILNNSSSAKNNGEVCVQNEECKSFKCESSTCIGNYLSGKFLISSNYKTVEFKSDVKCGVNGCGEDIFCLPANSNLKVELRAADLFNCVSDDVNCANKSPYSQCVNNICVDQNSNRYPLSNMSLMNGVMDAASNSLDGNYDGYSYGPATYYDKNLPHNPSTGDSFKWSFWISNKIETDPPVITSIFPEINATSADLLLPVKVEFNKLMMGSSLKTGEVIINNVVHRLINLISGQLVGYWINSENKDVDPMDGEPDRTNVYINHGRFFEGVDYKSQIGSGVRDIYQNCFKPSSGLGCATTPALPFCCSGVPSTGPVCP